MSKLLTAFIVTLSFSVNAEFVERDWKVEGDKLITYDTKSGLEWLDLSYTNGNLIQDSISNVYRRTQEETEIGYEFLPKDLIGWRIANKEEVGLLLSHAFPTLIIPFDTFYISSSTQVEWAYYQEFGQTFGGELFNNGNAKNATAGFCLNTRVSPHNYGSQNLCYRAGASSNTVIGTESGYLQPVQNSNYPVWLVRGELISEEFCPAVVSEMSRQQAIDYIQHLSTQLVDPEAKLITPLEF